MGMFRNTLLLAQQGNEKAMEKLLNRYDPLLKKCSIIQGHFDEDLYQSLILEFVRAVFSPFPFVMRSALNAKKSLWLQRQFGNMCCSPTKCCTLQTSGIILYRLSSRSRKKEPALGL